VIGQTTTDSESGMQGKMSNGCGELRGDEILEVVGKPRGEKKHKLVLKSLGSPK